MIDFECENCKNDRYYLDEILEDDEFVCLICSRCSKRHYKERFEDLYDTLRKGFRAGHYKKDEQL